MPFHWHISTSRRLGSSPVTGTDETALDKTALPLRKSSLMGLEKGRCPRPQTLRPFPNAFPHSVYALVYEQNRSLTRSGLVHEPTGCLPSTTRSHFWPPSIA